MPPPVNSATGELAGGGDFLYQFIRCLQLRGCGVIARNRRMTSGLLPRAQLGTSGRLRWQRWADDSNVGLLG